MASFSGVPKIFFFFVVIHRTRPRVSLRTLPCVLVLPGTFHTRLNLRSQLEVDEVQASQR